MWLLDSPVPQSLPGLVDQALEVRRLTSPIVDDMIFGSREVCDGTGGDDSTT